MIKIIKDLSANRQDVFSVTENKIDVSAIVSDIINTVRADGDSALYAFSEKFDKVKLSSLVVCKEEIEKAKALYKEYESLGKKPYIMCADYIKGLDGFSLLKLGNTPIEIASNLYDKLLYGEKVADLIIAVAMPAENGIYMGIMNRLRKSCG